MSEMSEMNCAMLADVAAELALGVLTGRERADAIEHLDRCEGCRENVRKLTATGEELLGLLPPAEPPAGFETRVLDRLGLMTSAAPVALAPVAPAAVAADRGGAVAVMPRRDPPGKHGRRRASRPARWLAGIPRARQLLVAAAIAVVVAGAGVGGWASRPGGSPAQLTSAVMTSASRQPVGQVFVYRESPHWLYMTVDLENRNNDDTVSCQLITADGTLSDMGVFQLRDGYGWWGSPLPETGGMPRGARLIASDGTVLATATFTR
jgi:anti-sigma-K factor RskA